MRVGAGLPLVDLQNRLAADGRWFPPVPTFEGAFVGGTIATNAAGAATFKYGSTRAWVVAATIVLADGSIVDLDRSVTVDADGRFEIQRVDGSVTSVAIPAYRLPDVAKHSGGYYARPGMDVLDLFIGSEGTLGIVTAATLRVIRKPAGWIALVVCASEAQAIAITGALRTTGAIDVAGVEFIDAPSARLLDDDAWTRAQVRRPAEDSTVLLVQLEAGIDEFGALLQQQGVVDDVAMAARADARATARLLELREAVPVTVNRLVATAKSADSRIEKTAGDMIVPFEHLAASLDIYRDAFLSRGLQIAVWGHISDGNLHANLVPRTFQDVQQGREAILEIAPRIIALGGSPLAEHGVGRSAVKQALLRTLYGEAGIDQMRAVKRALDPDWKLAEGVIFPKATQP